MYDTELAELESELPKQISKLEKASGSERKKLNTKVEAGLRRAKDALASMRVELREISDDSSTLQIYQPVSLSLSLCLI